MRVRFPALVLLVLASACSIHSRVKTALETAPPVSRSVCVLFMDGLSKDAFDRLLKAGALPAIQRELLDRGLSVETAVTSVPSETYPNLSAMLTGLLPGHHGIPANIWLDRRLRLREAHTNIFRTYATSDFLAPEARTLYERMPAGSVAVTTPLARGATVHAKNLISLFSSYLRNDWTFLDRKTLDDAGDAYMGAAAGKLPPLVWAHLLGPDEVSHSDGPDSKAFQDLMSSVERGFDRLVRRLKRRHVHEHVLFVLVGDHGNAPYSESVNIEELVHRVLFTHPAEADCATHNCAPVPPKPEQRFDVGDAEIAVGAYRGAMIWLPATRPPQEIPRAFKTRKSKGKKTKRLEPRRPMPPRSEFAEALAKLPELQLVVTRGTESGRAEIYGPGGRSEIERTEVKDQPSRYAYRVIEGTDPLGYPHELASGEPRSADAWLALTAHTEYPDLVVQLVEFFDAERAPDVYITPRSGIGFRSGKTAGHGGLSRKETVVPLVFAGPGVSHGTRPFARTVDLAPTLLRYLGIPFDADDLDGDDLEIAPGGAKATPPTIESRVVESTAAPLY